MHNWLPQLWAKYKTTLQRHFERFCCSRFSFERKSKNPSIQNFSPFFINGMDRHRPVSRSYHERYFSFLGSSDNQKSIIRFCDRDFATETLSENVLDGTCRSILVKILFGYWDTAAMHALWAIFMQSCIQSLS